MRKTSDEICAEHNLFVIEKPAPTRTPRNIYLAEKAGAPTPYNIMRWDIDEAIEGSLTLKQFITKLESKGYTVKTSGKYATIKAFGRQHATRFKTLGESYTSDAIIERILENKYMTKIQSAAPKPAKIYLLKGSFKLKNRYKGLMGLYLHYCFRLGILPKNAPTKKLSAAMRAELFYLDEITKQTRLICKYKIETYGELASFIESREMQISELTNARNKLTNQLRRCTDENVITDYRAQKTEISNQLSTLRYELKTAENVKTRSKKMRENLRAEKREEKGKEKEIQR